MRTTASRNIFDPKEKTKKHSENNTLIGIYTASKSDSNIELILWLDEELILSLKLRQDKSHSEHLLKASKHYIKKELSFVTFD